MPTTFLIFSVIGLLFTLNAFRPLRAEVLSIFTFLAGWLTSELPLHHLAWQLLATAVFIRAGALHGGEGWAGLGIDALSWIGLVVLAREGAAAGAVVDAALAEGLGEDAPRGWSSGRTWKQVALPVVFRDAAVEKLRDIPYVGGGGRDQRLDIYRPRAGADGSPVLLYIHGGGWVIGGKREQGLPLLVHLARRGWVCVTINYRLSPKVAFPEHLIDCKRALAWTKRYITEYGGDPTRVVVSGASAGGHLAALLALTPARHDLLDADSDDDVDLSVRAAVPFYGVYDFTNRDGIRGRGFGRFIDKSVMRTTPQANPDLYRLASPMDQVNADAPPFLVVHGTNDSLVPVQEARSFVRLLRAQSRAPVVYAELPGTQHAFDLFRSIRTAEVVPRVERFLDAVLTGAPRP